MEELSSIVFMLSQLIKKSSLVDVIMSHSGLNTSERPDKMWQPKVLGLKVGAMVFIRKHFQLSVDKFSMLPSTDNSYNMKADH